ncbi:RNA polymerase factor sigma-54 [Calidifontibacillus erzurumensis]|uniref:RNA polymerase factor sigma-54 n=1 Tax=Calidifontibacillus erzurumensis TaxID=2741433 RepID=A0A8J8K9H1_9BACI|nr:RNA polymerase factor sigma-54 [Calidifontibacillus erzurumensis]NSL53166.1 RNA polymerase factor sigma-54 [Calidifontibacillus erzurumensis]
MKQGLVQLQTTKLVMTTELRQAISLLQFSSAELMQFLQEQATENPLLNVVEPLQIYASKKRKKKNSTTFTGEPFQKVDRYSNATSIHDHLLKQIGLMDVNGKEKQILDYLILSINDAGYFVGNIEEISARFSVTIEKVEELLGKIQECDPPGVGARNLQECLLLQLKNQQERNLLAEQIVEQHLEKLADRKWKEISQIIQEPIEKIQEVFDYIQTLNPRPGSAFTKEAPNYIIPDMIITRQNDGTFALSFNEDVIPTIKIDSAYESFMNKLSNEANKYLKEKLEHVHFIKKAYEQRLLTMQKVMEAILEKQAEFFHFEHGKLKPLTMKEVAEKIGVHESTVSRTVNGKYVQTPKGVFELKYFFTSTIQTENLEDVSSKAVKETIKAIIDKENKKKPLSDQQIAVILKEKHGYNISRRTVAKYREQLGILSSSKRKRY